MTRRFIIMGVAGCGKSSVGAAWAATGDIVYIDGDDLHPAENIAKMSSGVPLTDEDRAPWLEKVGDALAGADGAVAIGCSALKRRYRDAIRARLAEPVAFIHLAAERSVIEGRMAAREGHFMPIALLDSQFAALEPLAPDELGLSIDIARPLDEVVAACRDGARKVST